MSRLLINQYRKELETRKRYGGTTNEGAIRYAFATLLNGYCRPRDFILVEELSIESRLQTKIRLDGIVKDALRLDWGYWEAKDEKDSLDAEIEAKLSKGYPHDNILFEDTKTAVLIQNGSESLRIDMADDDALDTLLNQFLDYERAEVKDFRQAINNFSQDLPIIIDTLRKLIDRQNPPQPTSPQSEEEVISTSSNSNSPLTSPPQPPSPKGEGGVISTSSNSNSPLPLGEGLGVRANQNFIKARDKFLKICQESINPDITIDDIREMIIQHILTEDIFNNIFSEGQFHQENNIARQLNEVIKTFFTGNVKRNTFKTIQSYYNAIIRTASSIVNHQEKQKFLKVVYENFYKAYNPKEADRLGIVYTPNEIVKFMVQSTNYLLEKHFHKTLGDKGVEILDPCTGTGTFITEILESLLSRDIEYKYLHEIHCNEMSILPYYIANLNIEYSYQQITKQYLEFNNICLVDTLHPTDKGEKQMNLFAMNEENTDRIKRQNERKISVIIGNPPYNAKQENFNDNNANRKYDTIDKRIKDSYIKEGTAQNQIVVYDMYTRFIRWATDRLNDEGIIAFITNSSLIDARAFDGFRKCLENEFDYIYIIDLGGNIRANPKLSGTTHNVFGIQTGVTISFLIKSKKEKKSPCKIYYSRRPEFETNKEKLDFISKNALENIDFESIKPDKKHNWINQTDNDFDDLIALIDKDVKAGKTKAVKNEETGELENKVCHEAIFQLFSSGNQTKRDEWVFDINRDNLEAKVQFFINIYQQTLNNYYYTDKNKIKWDADLSKYLERNIVKKYNKEQIIVSLYRPFYYQYLYFDKHLNSRNFQWLNIYNQDDLDNKVIILPGISSPKDFHCLISSKIVDMNCLPAGCQCLSLYRYEKGERIENITDWALEKFRAYYQPSPPQPPSPEGEGGVMSKSNSSDFLSKGEGRVMSKSNSSDFLSKGEGGVISKSNSSDFLSKGEGGVISKSNSSDFLSKGEGGVISKSNSSDSPLLMGEGLGVRANSPMEEVLDLSEIVGINRQIPRELLEKARELRKKQTSTEKILWECLRGNRFFGFKFRRQHNIASFIVDFYCHSEKLVIEIDGKIHDEENQKSNDKNRDEWLKSQGLKVLRIKNEIIINNLEEALNIIAENLLPSPVGEGLGVRANPVEEELAMRVKSITKEDIFYYVYGVLHNPEYRSKYELNLKREFPRIPFYEDFWLWVNWGKKLMDLHLNYKEIEPYPLNIINVGANGRSPLANGTEKSIKPKLKADKINHQIIIDEVTTLTEIPPLAWEYKLGNRSALEWILDQYKEKKSKDKTIAEKFNNYRFADYKEEVIELLKRVTTVSVETIRIIEQMKSLS